jgi:ABC-2 type transport system permease protein
MKDIILITGSSIKNNLKSKALTIAYVAVTIMISVGIALIFCLLLIAPEVGKSLPDRPKLELYLCLAMYSTCIITLGINMNIFAFQSITKEKSRGNIESLLATPLSAKKIWFAKSLAVFIPGMILAEILTLITLLTVNFIYFVPKTGFIYNHWIGITCFLTVPLVYFALSLLAHLVGLTGKPANGNVIAQIFLPVVLTLMINLTVRDIIDATSWPLALADIGISFVFVLIVIFMQSRITRERIVLSR